MKNRTNLEMTIGNKKYPVFVKYGSSRRTYYIYFKNRNLWHIVSSKDCTILD